MLKMFTADVPSAATPEYWDANWEGVELADSRRGGSADPLRPLFERYVRPGKVLLEGGCGHGGFVASQAGRGVRAVGVDFALDSLAAVRRDGARLMLAACDVARLPLAAASVDAYFSGGVVEHFEDGPAEALDEARRVLRRGGHLLISVPYESPLRRLLLRRRAPWWRRVDRHAAEPAPPGSAFFQYVYSPVEFESLLAEHGFVVRCRKPLSIVWGLYELPMARRALVRMAHAASRRLATGGDGAVRASPSGVFGPVRALVKRLVVAEDETVPVLGLGVRGLGWLAANMMLYVCEPA
jgi:SAM-dependent methyltransferase